MDTFVAVLAGASLGLVSARFGSAMLQAWVFGVTAGQWTTGMPAVLALLGLAVAAALVTMRKTANLPVWSALRGED